MANEFGERVNTEALNQAIKLLLQFLTGANAFGVPNHAFTVGKSMQHNIGQYQYSQDRKAFTSPIGDAIHNVVGERLYNSTMRMLGYSDAEAAYIRNDRGGAQLMQKALSFGSSVFLSRSVDMFANTAYRRLYANQSVNIDKFSNSFAAAGKNIVNSISDGTLQGYSISEAFTVASMFTRQGRYDYTGNKQRSEAIKRDLQDYAEGINNLRDGLQGSLEQVLTSFEKLTGSSATVMHKDRFTALSRSLYGATTFGGVTPQLLQSTIATQHAYLQGTGVTQATSMALGTINANILANGVSVEGATQNSMNEALNRQAARWMTTGKAKELTAAFGWWADPLGKARNAETFAEFENYMGGRLDDISVRNYLERNNVSGAYINSARNRRNMASPYIYNAFHRQNIQSYQNSFNRLQKRHGLKVEDMWLTDDELTDKLMKEAAKNGQVSRSDIDRITNIVEERRNIIQGVTNATDADTGLNLLRNQKQAIAQQNQAKVTKRIQMAIGQQVSIGGVAGILQNMVKKEGVGRDDIAGALGAWLGVNVSSKSLGNLSEQDLETTIRTSIESLNGRSLSDSQYQGYLKFFKTEAKKMSSSEYDMLFKQNNDKRVGKDGKTTWGSIRKQLLDARAGNLDDNYRETLKKAREQGFITEEQEFLAMYSADNDVDFSNNPEALKTAQRVYKNHKKAKELGLTGSEVVTFAQRVERIRSGAVSADAKKVYEEEIKEQLKNSDDIKPLVEKVNKSTGGEREKAQRELDDKLNAAYANLTKGKEAETGFFLEQIMSAVKDILQTISSS